MPEGHWSGDVSRQRPEAVLRIEETMPLGRGRGAARISSTVEIESELSNHSGVDEVRKLGEGRYAVDIAQGGGGFIKPIREVGVIPHSLSKLEMDGSIGLLNAQQKIVAALFNYFVKKRSLTA